MTSTPSSPCFRTDAFCATANFDALIVPNCSPSEESLVENFSFKLPGFQGENQFLGSISDNIIDMTGPKPPFGRP